MSNSQAQPSTPPPPADRPVIGHRLIWWASAVLALLALGAVVTAVVSGQQSQALADNAATREAVATVAQGAALNAQATAVAQGNAAETLRVEVEAQATYFSAQQVYISTIVAGVGINPLVGATLEPTAFLASMTQIAEYNQREPVIEVFNGIEMVQVPPGCFIMGTILDFDAAPPHQQCFDAAFWIDRTEVTQGQFREFGGVKANPNYFEGDQRPVETITWFEARDFCELRGARLPTEREWEYAARGPDSLAYPWGNEWDEDKAVWSGNSEGQTATVGSRLSGISWVGALDMSGNVWEWLSSVYEDYPYVVTDGDENINRIDVSRAVRGGSWDYSNSTALRAAVRNGVTPVYDDNLIGLRCALS